jgi:hypothetical protein
MLSIGQIALFASMANAGTVTITVDSSKKMISINADPNDKTSSSLIFYLSRSNYVTVEPGSSDTKIMSGGHSVKKYEIFLEQFGTNTVANLNITLLNKAKDRNLISFSPNKQLQQNTGTAYKKNEMKFNEVTIETDGINDVIEILEPTFAAQRLAITTNATKDNGSVIIVGSQLPVSIQIVKVLTGAGNDLVLLNAQGSTAKINLGAGKRNKFCYATTSAFSKVELTAQLEKGGLSNWQIYEPRPSGKSTIADISSRKHEVAIKDVAFDVGNSGKPCSF